MTTITIHLVVITFFILLPGLLQSARQRHHEGNEPGGKIPPRFLFPLRQQVLPVRPVSRPEGFHLHLPSSSGSALSGTEES